MKCPAILLRFLPQMLLLVGIAMRPSAVAAVAAVLSSPPPPTISSRLLVAPVTVGDRYCLEVRIAHQANDQVAPPLVDEPDLHQCGRLERQRFLAEGQLESIFLYTLISFRSGTQVPRLSAAQVVTNDGRWYTLPLPPVVIAPAAVATSSATACDIVGPLPPENYPLLLWIEITLALTAAVSGFLLQRRCRIDAALSAPDGITEAGQSLAAAFDRFRRRPAGGPDERRAVTEDIVRWCRNILEDYYGIATPPLTFHDWLAALVAADCFDEREMGQLTRMVSIADLTSYARYCPEDDDLAACLIAAELLWRCRSTGGSG